MGILASVDDLQKLMKRTFPEGEDLDQADMVLTIVSAWARAVSGQQWPDAPAGVPADVTAVVLTASRRELRNPDKIVGKTKGPFAVQYDKPPAGFFSEPELDILRRFKTTRGGLFTVSTTRGERRRRPPAFLYWDRAYGDLTAPWQTFVAWMDEYADCDSGEDAGLDWVTGRSDRCGDDNG